MPSRIASGRSDTSSRERFPGRRHRRASGDAQPQSPRRLRPSPRCRRLQRAELLLSRGHLNTSPVCLFPVVWKGAPTSSLEDIKAENGDQSHRRQCSPCWEAVISSSRPSLRIRLSALD